MVASYGFLEDELRQCSKEEGVTLADSVETLGVDLRTRVKRLRAKEKARRRKCMVRFSLVKKNRAFQKNYMKVVVKKLLRTGMVPARTWRVHAVEMAPTERLKLRRHVTAAAGKKECDLVVLVHGSLWSGSGGETFFFGHPVLGRRSPDRKMAP